jgi:phosphatidylserine/phosphatidylglycerophosphate/cardiolipin synthase-like enzyme
MALHAYENHWVKAGQRRRKVVEVLERAFQLWSESRIVKVVPWSIRTIWKSPTVELMVIDNETGIVGSADQYFIYADNGTDIHDQQQE